MWTIMLLLGAYHGINPGMGWLFAVALGMQQGSARGVWRALPPIGLGHALAVGVVLLAAGLAQLVVPLGLLKVTVASILLGFGVYRLWRHRHPRYGGMRVGFRDLTTWSFLMASAHGAGFMVLPFVIRMSNDVKAVDAAMPSHTGHMTAAASAGTGSILLGLHTLSYLAVTGLAAWIVYRWLGLALLRTAWFNLDLLWAAVLAVTGAVVLLS
ncbi:MAG: hypothetical protein DMG17_20075 [Acidobacteria bacterium]|nr:MAG: hypothetical protein DMG17_20075 [Acidobacteriota bacterium]